MKRLLGRTGRVSALLITTALITAALCTTTPLSAQVKIQSHVIGSGATSASGGNVTVQATVGQGVIGLVVGNQKISQGFWQPLQPAALGVHTGNQARNQEAWRLQSYPNPMRSEGMIEFAMATAGDLDVVLYNAVGQEVTTLYSGYHEGGRLSVTLTVDGLASGTYTVVAITETGPTALPIVVRH